MASQGNFARAMCRLDSIDGGSMDDGAGGQE